MAIGKIRRDPLDILFSKYMRLKSEGVCEHCLCTFPIGKLQISHLFGRRHKAVRWSERNVSVLCFTCHRQFHESPVDHVNWFMGKRGQQEYDLLLAELRTPAKYIDREGLTLYYKEKLKELDK